MKRDLFNRSGLLLSPVAGDGGPPPPQPTAPPASDAQAPENPKQIAQLQKQVEKLQGQLAAAQNEINRQGDLVAGKNREMLELTNENRRLNEKLQAMADKETQRAKDETLIVEKMSKGLTRPQAITVIERQKAFNVAKARAEKIQSIANSAKSPAEAVESIKKAFPDATELEMATKAQAKK